MLEPASTWFSDAFELRQLCSDANSQALSEKARDFAAEMSIKANSQGLEMKLSTAQLEWLCKIADWDVPRRR